MTCNLEQVMAAVVQAIGSGAVPHAYGPTHLYEKAGTPNVVWMRGPSSFTAPRAAGGNPRSLMTQKVKVLVHISGRTEDEADAVLQAEIVGLSRIANTSARPVSAEPVTENVEAKSYGTNLILTIEVDVPVLDEARPTAQAKTIAFEHVSTAGDGWLEYGE